MLFHVLYINRPKMAVPEAVNTTAPSAPSDDVMPPSRSRHTYYAFSPWQEKLAMAINDTDTYACLICICQFNSCSYLCAAFKIICCAMILIFIFIFYNCNNDLKRNNINEWMWFVVVFSRRINPIIHILWKKYFKCNCVGMYWYFYTYISYRYMHRFRIIQYVILYLHKQTL